MTHDTQTFQFQTEARQLLDLMIHSVYSNKDVFLRELISNASDALDKLRVESLRSESLRDLVGDPHIRIETDGEARTLTVTDNGIGMSREELIANIGTIARSGTKEFAELLRSNRESGEAVSADLIGQFGVGFYSTFMVADRVTLLTRRVGEESATLWESTGDGSYTLAEAERPTHGTTVTLHLKPADGDELKDYAEEWTIRSIVRKYSDFVTYPIRMEVERTEKGEGEEEKRVKKDETLNSMKAIWTRPKDEVKPEEYNEFYKHIAHDWTDPLNVMQMKAEGTFEYYALLFIPSKAPLDLYVRDAHRGLHLYVKRIFITDNAEELMPQYLRFMRGVVDSEDLPLNISREVLQQNRQIQMIRKRLTKKTLETLAQMRNGESEKFRTFWREFGPVLKEGIFQDHENAATILDVALFHSTASDELTTLKEYVGRMKEEQEAIYFITGDDRSVMASSPHLEAFSTKGYEVLLLADPVDGIWTSGEQEYEGKKLRSVARGIVEVGSDEEKKAAEEKKREGLREYGPVLMALQSKLEDRIKEVRLSSRLTSSAACLVGDEGDMTPQMERLMRAMGQEVPHAKQIMEINPDHPLLARLHAIYQKDNGSRQLDDFAELLYGQAALAEGAPIPDPAKFSRLVADLMVRAADEPQAAPTAQGEEE